MEFGKKLQTFAASTLGISAKSVFAPSKKISHEGQGLTAVEKIFNNNFSDYRVISVRMNDFWFIHTKYFKSMIQLLFNIHKQPISSFVTGSEQSLYEYYLINC